MPHRRIIPKGACQEGACSEGESFPKAMPRGRIPPKDACHKGACPEGESFPKAHATKAHGEAANTGQRWCCPPGGLCVSILCRKWSLDVVFRHPDFPRVRVASQIVEEIAPVGAVLELLADVLDSDDELDVVLWLPLVDDWWQEAQDVGITVDGVVSGVNRLEDVDVEVLLDFADVVALAFAVGLLVASSGDGGGTAGESGQGLPEVRGDKAVAVSDKDRGPSDQPMGRQERQLCEDSGCLFLNGWHYDHYGGKIVNTGEAHLVRLTVRAEGLGHLKCIKSNHLPMLGRIREGVKKMILPVWVLQLLALRAAGEVALDVEEHAQPAVLDQDLFGGFGNILVFALDVPIEAALND
ncbi:hypothetical protein BDK51DRAFT_51531 [Blyttiomyces helicus]|uniref:Uncharacterized protein n=1 Tax=Blyttiomyces helicus TaxID=388810 RepID=A0A4P9WPR3_9FUNG|nr:hypothetical protein BDK51DRAFT_51531 [Blyttiomyces helicus]|eukprot:RKO92806.1 hypothetical protein BDK51DRAFT_51531 [Blyttiomyces helicus]